MNVKLIHTIYIYTVAIDTVCVISDVLFLYNTVCVNYINFIFLCIKISLQMAIDC